MVHDQPIGGRLPVDLKVVIGRDGADRCGRSDPVGCPMVRGRRHRHAGRGHSERGHPSHDGRSLQSATKNVDPVDRNYLLCVGAVVDVLRYRGRSRVFGDRPTLGLDIRQLAQGRRCSGLRMTSSNCMI